jgi:hypothetical protein
MEKFNSPRGLIRKWLKCKFRRDSYTYLYILSAILPEKNVKGGKALF